MLHFDPNLIREAYDWCSNPFREIEETVSKYLTSFERRRVKFSLIDIYINPQINDYNNKNIYLYFTK